MQPSQAEAQSAGVLTADLICEDSARAVLLSKMRAILQAYRPPVCVYDSAEELFNAVFIALSRPRRDGSMMRSKGIGAAVNVAELKARNLVIDACRRHNFRRRHVLEMTDAVVNVPAPAARDGHLSEVIARCRSDWDAADTAIWNSLAESAAGIPCTPVREIAENLGMKENTVTRRRLAIFAHLKEQLQKN